MNVITRRLLQFNHLLISELGPIMHQCETMISVTTGAQSRLCNSSPVNFHTSAELAYNALEKCFPHFRHNV